VDKGRRGLWMCQGVVVTELGDHGEPDRILDEVPGAIEEGSGPTDGMDQGVGGVDPGSPGLQFGIRIQELEGISGFAGVEFVNDFSRMGTDEVAEVMNVEMPPEPRSPPAANQFGAPDPSWNRTDVLTTPVFEHNPIVTQEPDTTTSILEEAEVGAMPVGGTLPPISEIFPRDSETVAVATSCTSGNGTGGSVSLVKTAETMCVGVHTQVPLVSTGNPVVTSTTTTVLRQRSRSPGELVDRSSIMLGLLTRK